MFDVYLEWMGCGPGIMYLIIYIQYWCTSGSVQGYLCLRILWVPSSIQLVRLCGRLHWGVPQVI